MKKLGTGVIGLRMGYQHLNRGSEALHHKGYLLWHERNYNRRKYSPRDLCISGLPPRGAELCCDPGKHK